MSNATHKLGIAVVGCGYWGRNYVRVFDELTSSRLVAVCEQKPEVLQGLALRFPGVYLASELEETLAHPEVEAVAICTDAASHYQIARRCLLAGKHVLVEKPMTTSLADAEALTLLAEAESRILMVGHTFIYNAGIRKVKEYLEQRDSTIYYLHGCRTNLGPIRRDVNALWDLATHDIAIFNYLLDSVPQWVSAVGSNVLRNCREDVGFLSLGYENNILGHIHVSWADPNKSREVVVVCSDKRIVFDDLNGIEKVRVFEKGVRSVPAEPLSYGENNLQIRDGDIISPRVEVSEPLKDQCRHFLECVRTGSTPLTGGREGADVLRVLEAVDRSIKLKGAQVEVQANGKCGTVEHAIASPIPRSSRAVSGDRARDQYGVIPSAA
jgi:predicted dehydrogenase